MGFSKVKRNNGSYIQWNDKLTKILSVKFGLTTPSELVKKRHKRHKRHLFNDDNGLRGDDVSDDVAREKETSQERHAVTPRNYNKNDNGDDSDVFLQVQDTFEGIEENDPWDDAEEA